MIDTSKIFMVSIKRGPVVACKSIRNQEVFRLCNSLHSFSFNCVSSVRTQSEPRSPGKSNKTVVRLLLSNKEGQDSR